MPALADALSASIARIVPIREAATAIENFAKNGARGKIAIQVEGGF
jgi:hypothetical protein